MFFQVAGLLLRGFLAFIFLLMNNVFSVAQGRHCCSGCLIASFEFILGRDLVKQAQSNTPFKTLLFP
jgi:hypothetical protein